MTKELCDAGWRVDILELHARGLKNEEAGLLVEERAQKKIAFAVLRILSDPALEMIVATPNRLLPLCRKTRDRYLVTSATLADATPLPAPTDTAPTLRDFKLYTCP